MMPRLQIFPLLLAGATLALLAEPAAAQQMRTEGPPAQSALMQWADATLPRNQFVLNSDKDVELVRFSSPRDIELCVAQPDKAAGVDRSVAVQATWDGNKGTIQPGNCLSFDASRVTVKMLGQLPQDLDLMGSFRVIHH